MGRARTYGARKKHASAAASAIFGQAPSNSPPIAPLSPERSALADITSAVSNLNIGDVNEDDEDKSGDQNDDDDDEDSDESSGSIEESESESEEDSDDLVPEQGKDDLSLEQHLDNSILDGAHQHLLPLVTAYGIDTGRILTSNSWAGLLPEDCIVVKIAEASYAEVYRISIPSGETSIIKVMRIESPDDPESGESGTAIRVENIVSEVRIMNVLTELPGFVRFKDAHIIRGRPVQAFIDAYEEREAMPKGRPSEFPHPEEYTSKSEFLAIELGDAGCVLEDFVVKSIDQLWDILLGTILALAKGEMANEFEHRDLHENNICISVSPNPPPHSGKSPLKLGFAGIKVTLIDYGLSRAKLQNSSIVFLDLEEDPAVFQGSEGVPQFNAYRRMRTNLMTGEHSSKTKAWHASSTSRNPDRTWAEYTPYSNVVWIGYMVGYLKKVFKKANSGKVQALKKFNDEMKELNRRLDCRTKVENGGFGTATEVLWYCVESGWVSEVQAEEYGADVSTIVED